MQITEIENDRMLAIFDTNPIFQRNAKMGVVMDVAEAFARLAKVANVKATYMIVPRDLLAMVRNQTALTITADPVKRIVEKQVRGKGDIKLVVLYGNTEDLNIVKTNIGQGCKILFASDADEVAPHDNGPVRVIPGHVPEECWRGSWWRILPRAMLSTPPPPATNDMPGGFIHEHDFLTEKGLLLNREGKIEEAYNTFGRVLELHPDCLRALYMKSMFLIMGAKKTTDSNERDTAVKDAGVMLQRCVDLDPNFPAVYLAYSELYEVLGDKTRAASNKAQFEALKKKETTA